LAAIISEVSIASGGRKLSSEQARKAANIWLITKISLAVSVTRGSEARKMAFLLLTSYLLSVILAKKKRISDNPQSKHQ